MELINDLSQAASEVHEENIRYKAEINYWRQQCGWLSQKLNQIQISKPEVEVRYVQKEKKNKWLQDFHDIEDDLNEDEKEYVKKTIESKKTRLFLVRNVNRRKKGLFETYEERNAKTQKYIKHLKREKIEEVQKLREKFNVMLNESNKKVQELDMELEDMYEELRNLEDELSEKDTNAKKEKEESAEIIQTFQVELARIKRHLECSEEKNKMQAALIAKIKNNTPKTAARKEASSKQTRQKPMKQKLENTEEEEKVYIIPSLDLVTTPSSASTGDIEGKAIDLFNVYGESNILWPELMDNLY